MLSSETVIEVNFGDCDPAGIVFYPNYFRWFDQCLNAMIARAGLDLMTMVERYGVVGLPLIEAGSRFFIPSSPGDKLLVRTTVTECGRKTIKVAHTFLKGDAVALEGWEVRVWARAHPDDPKRLQTVEIPDDVRQIFTR